ncbi:MAG TPA: F0F1 ATP synthase subunit A, partial [Longimicrobiales bacterium]|nr:F0F1 ATP synthase subunit A [Longimicrobiales bacterium]
GGEKYAPFVVTLFFFIWVANLLGLVPWGTSPTANISVTAALAVMSLVVVEVAGMKALGLRGYSRTIFFWPHDMPLPMRLMMFVIMTPVELLGKFSKPFALAIRLFANMVAGKFVLYSLMGLIFVAAPLAGWVFPWLAPVLMSVAFLVLKLFVAVLQAYIFAMLTSVFIGLIRHAH